MKKKDYSISLIRFIGLCMIIACHVCNYYGSELAFWLNCGVQIFLLISGFLYGHRNRIEPKAFYTKNIPKILIDYWIFVLLMIPVYLFIVRREISVCEYIKLLLGISVEIPGMGHLWYISTILVCYAITPFVIKLIKPKVKVLPILFVFLVSEILFAILPGFTGAWINCFILGLLLGNDHENTTDESRFYRRVLSVATPATVILCGIEIALKYIFRFEIYGILAKAFNTVFHYGHIALAMVIFFGIKSIMYRNVFVSQTQKVRLLDITDKYSYDAYLVHLFFVLGPFSFFIGRNNSADIAVGCVLLSAYIILAALILRRLSSTVEKLLFRSARE